ncbi:MAG: ROK family transcriptional regulator [Thermomicrobiales bacterium]|nr:ROK family transcriptional regulator [Thermomicrobiales bacterium]
MIEFNPSGRQRDVLALIRERGTATRAEIQSATGLSASRVSRLTGELLSSGVIVIEERLPSGEGRPQEVLALAPRRHFVIGLDVGGLVQQVAITDLRGELLQVRSSRKALDGPRSDILDFLKELVDLVLDDTGVDAAGVLGLGVGLRAIVDPVTGIVSAGPEAPSWSPSWTNFAIRDELSALFPWKAIVVDDTVRASAVAERRMGSALGIDDFVFVLADTGIGAALMINGKPYIGPGHLAGEIGHVTIDPNGPMCGCGKRGCIEAYASSSALLLRSREETGDPSMELDDLIAAGDGGCEPHRSILEAGGGIMGRGLAILFNLLSPRQIVLGGAASASTVYRQTAMQVARQQTVGKVRDSVHVVPASGHPHTGVLGACSMVLDTLF